MDRKSFLDAQLWLEKVDEPKDPWGKTIRNFASNHGSISLFPILIKSSPETINSQPVQDEEETNEQSVVPAFCCFHVGNRFCFFRSNEKDQDQSQLVFELALIEKEQVLLLEEDKENSQHSGEGDGSCSNIMQAGIYARFDRKYTYLIDMGQIKKLLFPSSSSSANTPPFICFEFPNVMLRVWLDMDKCENNESARCGLKNALIHLQQSHLMRKKRFHETQQIPLQAKHPCEWRTLLLKKSPNVTKRWVSAKEFVNKASNVLDTNSMSALHEMIQSYKQKGIPSQEDGSSQEEKKQEEIFVLAYSQIIELIGALILHFRQLSVSHQDIQDVIDTLFDFHSLKRCDRHDQCFQLPVSPSASPVCVTSLWHAWDEFLDASNVSQLSSDPATLQATIEHAAIAFR
jgi:hypothetical protein